MHERRTTAGEFAIEARELGIRYRRYLRQVNTLKESVVGLFKGNHFESFWALRGLDLTIRKGERVGVVGPNGAGKTTLLKAFSGVLPPAEGSVVVCGRIAPLFGLGGGFRNDLTGRENIYLNGAILGMSRRDLEGRVDRIVEFAGVGDFIEAPLHTYSSGMRARLGFSVATDISPEILLLDEVFSAGDAEFRAKATARLETFFKEGKTVVVVSHAMDQIKRLCNRALYIESGRVAADGEPNEVIDHYLEAVRKKKEISQRSAADDAGRKVARDAPS